MAEGRGKPNLLDMTPEEIAAVMADLGKEGYRAKQILKWLYQRGVREPAAMTTLSRAVRARLESDFRIARPDIEAVLTSRDTTRKVLFRLHDGLFIESVLIPGRNHWTACLSTQAGCAMGCAFCLTGKSGLKRNLLPSEITGQMLALREIRAEDQEIRNIVLMGMGEPLANYAHTLQAIRLLTADDGLGFSNRRITLSTCGLAPGIVQLGRDVSINLAISLNAPDDEIRDRLMPVNRTYPLATLLDACRSYPMPGRRMLTFEYILMAGVNDAPREAEALVRLLKGLRCKLNLIPFNEYPGTAFRSPAPETILRFQEILIRNHFTAILRASRGQDILAACGQLSGRASCETKTTAQGLQGK